MSDVDYISLIIPPFIQIEIRVLLVFILPHSSHTEPPAICIQTEFYLSHQKQSIIFIGKFMLKFYSPIELPFDHNQIYFR